MFQFLLLGLGCLITHSSNAWAMAGHAPKPELETAQNIDLNRYAGKWYEIAKLPQIFEAGCVGVTSDYSIRPDGKVDVKNTCRLGSCDGSVSEVNGIAHIFDTRTQAKLKISFLWPLEGDYWILEVDPEYYYAVVGSPNRKSFWILSRNPFLPDDLVQSILLHYRTLGFKTENVVKTVPCD